MTDRPIIFSAPMIKALLDGRKTMTRRLAWRNPRSWGDSSPINFDPLTGDPARFLDPTLWQKVKPGDRLWCRENLICTGNGIWRWRADDEHVYTSRQNESAMIAWAHHEERGSVPSIHMPRWASRITLVITATKLERVQSITEADALAEGIDDLWLVQNHVPPPRKSSFRDLWNDLHGDGSWQANPEVVAVTFRVIKANIDAIKEAA